MTSKFYHRGVSIFCGVNLVFALHAFAGGDPVGSAIHYRWTSSDFGGGGYVTGLLQHPADPNILYIRTDVAGVFMSVDGGRSWKAVNGGMTEGYHHSVESFA
ncbi:MAG: hypothetical protein WB699_06440, partial [Bacteroidota bacterium]